VSLRPNHISAGALLGIAALHAGWARGAAFPFEDRAALAGHGTGRADPPGPAACSAVAVLLTASAALVAGWPRGALVVQRAGATTVTVVLGLRGCLGLLGRTGLVAPGSVSPEFRARDRRLYSPLCLAIAAGAAPRRPTLRHHHVHLSRSARSARRREHQSAHA
jgi:hypothetical protein